MSNYLEYLDGAMGEETVILHNFFLEYRKKGDIPICFIEGKEDSYYYRPRIELLTGSLSAKFIVCNGKKRVIGINKLIKQYHEYKDARLFYFVDKDFANNNDVSKEIYVTPVYSIENLYTSKKSFIKILEDVFYRQDKDPDYKRSIELYEARQKEFHNCVFDLNVRIACDRELNKDLRSKVSISAVEINKYVKIDLFEIKSLENINELIELFNHIGEESLINKSNEFKEADKQKYFRGKFEFQFFCLFLDKLVRDSNVRPSDKRIFFSKRIKTNLNLSSNQLLTLSSFAETPPCLGRYIQDIWNGKIRKEEVPV